MAKKECNLVGGVTVIKKLSNKWWLFTLLSGVCAYLNPYIGFFSIIITVMLFFDTIIFIILKGHYNIFRKKLVNKNGNSSVIKSIFFKEVFMFKAMKLFTTVFTLFMFFAIVVTNIEEQTIIAPFYFSIIERNFALQLLMTVFAFGSKIFSFVLFCAYANTYKDKFKELEEQL